MAGRGLAERGGGDPHPAAHREGLQHRQEARIPPGMTRACGSSVTSRMAPSRPGAATRGERPRAHKGRPVREEIPEVQELRHVRAPSGAVRRVAHVRARPAVTVEAVDRPRALRVQGAAQTTHASGAAGVEVSRSSKVWSRMVRVLSRRTFEPLRTGGVPSASPSARRSSPPLRARPRARAARRRGAERDLPPACGPGGRSSATSGRRIRRTAQGKRLRRRARTRAVRAAGAVP